MLRSTDRIETSHAGSLPRTPELIAANAARAAGAGPEGFVASTDCGLGGRVHPQIAWAKLETLAAGARIATERLWGSDPGHPACAVARVLPILATQRTGGVLPRIDPVSTAHPRPRAVALLSGG